MSEASDILKRARQAAIDAFDITYEADDAADAALRIVLEVLVNPPWGSAEVYAAEMLAELAD